MTRTRGLVVLIAALLVVRLWRQRRPAGSPRSPWIRSSILFVGDTSPGPLDGHLHRRHGDTLPTGQLIWASSDQDVVEVDSLTGRVVAVGPGDAIIIARANGISGGALLIVSRPLQVTLLLDTIYVMPGDTITIPVAVEQDGGSPPAAWFSPSPNPAIYTVDSATGLLTAVSPGGPVRFIVHADSVADTGAVDVRLLTDTTGGRTYFTVLGTVIRRSGAQARALNYRRLGDTLTFRLNAGIPTTTNAVENVVITLRGPCGTRDVRHRFALAHRGVRERVGPDLPAGAFLGALVHPDDQPHGDRALSRRRIHHRDPRGYRHRWTGHLRAVPLRRPAQRLLHEPARRAARARHLRRAADHGSGTV
jgi:hypothetical protein